MKCKVFGPLLVLVSKPLKGLYVLLVFFFSSVLIFCGIIIALKDIVILFALCLKHIRFFGVGVIQDENWIGSFMEQFVTNIG